jgi:hypothetical protein
MLHYRFADAKAMMLFYFLLVMSFPIITLCKIGAQSRRCPSASVQAAAAGELLFLSQL